MTPTPNAVERCKAVPITDRWPNGWGSCSNLVDTAIMWEAIDLLVAENARLRDVARAADTFYRASNSYIYELTIRTGPDGIERGVDRLRVPYDDLPGHEERTRKREALNAAERAYRSALDAARSSGARGGGE